jgi:hypothetical protein
MRFKQYILETEERIVFHGSANKYDSLKLGYGNNELGTGLYFASDINVAKHYGKHIVSLDANKLKFKPYNGKTPLALVNYLIKNVTDDEIWQGWDENKNKAIKMFTASLNGTFGDDIQTIWYDLYRKEEEKFCQLVSKFGIDGVYIKERNNWKDIFLIYNVEKANSLLKYQYVEEENANETMTLYHGGNLDAGFQDSITHKKGRWEYGPGLYLISRYYTAKEYAKGSRKLYKVTVQKGNNISEVNVEKEKIFDFVDIYVTKKSRKEIKERLLKFEKEGKIPVEFLVNLVINMEAISTKDSNELRLFLVNCGVDYTIDKHPFGWDATMLVVHNPKKIIKTELAGKNDFDDLPQEFSK